MGTRCTTSRAGTSWRKPIASLALMAGTGRASPAPASGPSRRALRFAAAYVTRVRITVRAGEERIVREGCGAGESNAASPGQAHEFAAKAAETDATKRALSTFGNSFGLSLYAGASDQNGRRNPAHGLAPAAKPMAGPECHTTPQSNGSGGQSQELRPAIAGGKCVTDG